MRIAIVAAAAMFAAGAAQAADMSAMAPTPYNWSGFYAGLSGGYAWTDSGTTYDDPGLSAYSLDLNPAGWAGGFQIGVNNQFSNNVVVGVEADYAFSDVSDTIADELGGAPYTITSKSDYFASARARVGMAFDRSLVYATGGVVWTHGEVTATQGNLSDEATLYGWTIGLGIEQAVTDKISVFTDYRYADFESHTWFAGEAYSSTSNPTSHAVRAGVNFHF